MQEGGSGETTQLCVGMRIAIGRRANCVGAEASGGDTVSEIHHYRRKPISAR